MSMWRLIARNIVRPPVAEPAPALIAEDLAQLAAALKREARDKLGRALSIRQVDAGSCNGCELEIHALNNPYYDMERFGLHVVASPRHADVLLVTGVTTCNMAFALKAAYDAAPPPRWVVAVGDCAVDGGCFKDQPHLAPGSTAGVIPVDLRIPGCPPEPARLLAGLLALIATNR